MTSQSRNSVVIVRLRGRTDLGSTLMEILLRYSEALRNADSKLVLISDNQHVLGQHEVTGVTDAIGEENLYRSDEWPGHTAHRAHADARDWVSERQA